MITTWIYWRLQELGARRSDRLHLRRKRIRRRIQYWDALQHSATAVWQARKDLGL